MICERCQQKPASVHVQQTINGKKTARHLCQECAAQFEMPVSLEQFFQGFLGSMAASPPASPIVCPECGFTHKMFKESGRLGCKACYSTFRRELTALFKQVHGSSEHQGKIPQKAGVGIIRKRTLESLRGQLHKAVASEAYEEAARLRDEIRRIEAATGEGAR